MRYLYYEEQPVVEREKEEDSDVKTPQSADAETPQAAIPITNYGQEADAEVELKAEPGALLHIQLMIKAQTLLTKMSILLFVLNA